MEFANDHFALTKPRDNGVSLLEELTAIRDQTGIVSPRLEDARQVPFYTRHVWEWFCDLGRTRTAGFSSIESISWTEIRGYFDLIGIRPQRWEVMAIVQLDIAFMNSRLKKELIVSAKDVILNMVKREDGR